MSKPSLREVTAPAQSEKLVEVKLESKEPKDLEGPSFRSPASVHSSSEGSSSLAPAPPEAQLLTVIFKALQGHPRAVSHESPAFESPPSVHLHRPRPQCANMPVSMQGPGVCILISVADGCCTGA